MGPKDKSKNKKGGNVPEPVEDTSEQVTELMKQFFEIQMVDIETKINRLQNQQVTLREMTEKVEQSMVEYEREKGMVIEEMKGRLEQKENEKLAKRDHLQWLGHEVKLFKQRLEDKIVERQKKFDDMVVELSAELENVEEDLRILEDFKTNKTEYIRGVEQAEEARMETERQHQRNLFDIRQKIEMAKIKMKKDLEMRLLQLSIEFQETSRIKIGAPIHRMLQENRAIENELRSIKTSIRDYYMGYESSKGGTRSIRERERATVEERDKFLARCIIQVNIIKALEKRNKELAAKIEEFLPLQVENEKLTRRFKFLESEVEKKKNEGNEVRRLLAAKKEEANRMNEVAAFVRKNTRKLQILLRNSIRAAEEAMAIQLIPIGETEEEKYMSAETQLKLYQRRRELAFKKKGKLLGNLREILLRAHLTENEWRMLATNEIVPEPLDFVALLNPSMVDLFDEEVELERAASPGLSGAASGSDVSLPRSLSPEETEVRKAPAAPEEEEEELEGEVSAASGTASVVEVAQEKEEEAPEEPEEVLPGEDGEQPAAGDDEET